MKKAMTITYEVDSGLYVNVTNRCSNSCDFCIRKNDDGAYGSDSLWLQREPTVTEICESILSRDLSKYGELVFCGYGEPSVRLYDICEVARAVRVEYPEIKIRINTNGHSDLIHGKNTAPDYAGVFDTVSVSLNTPNAEKYVEICHPVYQKQAFYAMLEFTKNVKNYVQNTVFSVVRQFISEAELSECQRIADECGVYLKVREYIG
jgi:TatD family-associated radical SAM protein